MIEQLIADAKQSDNSMLRGLAIKSLAFIAPPRQALEVFAELINSGDETVRIACYGYLPKIRERLDQQIYASE